MSRNSKLKIIYYTAAGIYGATMASSDIGLSNWRWWVSMLCICVSYIVGRAIND